MADMFRLDILTDENDVDMMTGILTQFANEGWQETSLPTGETQFTIHCEHSDIIDSICSAASTLVPNAQMTRSVAPQKDWQAEWRQFFTPVECGSFIVLPPWLLSDAPKHLKPIVIEPRCAFGTGHHNTTVLCLTAISELISEGRLCAGMRFFDLGTGTGILGMGCAMSGMSGIGSDIDQLAVDNARENIALNHVKNFEIFSGSVEAAGNEQFDLVVANILAGPLCELSSGIMEHMKQGAVLILSGLLTVQADHVAETYKNLGTPKRIESGEWSALIWS